MGANRTHDRDDAGVRIRLDPDASEPVSVQLRDAIAARITRGRLLPGERLPPVRDLAIELELAPNTVAKAYRELEAAGYLDTRGRHGTFVAERLPEAPSDLERALAAASRTFAGRARQLGVAEREASAAVRRAFDER